ncbi:phospho-sugar mutase [Paenibacillus turpanensis]|uniref:phospho-sugar mutase n=1 Tax=Paenibacillus turpanensis TaxID=2689078 RepID=UPI00140C548B|nr:phospho-sugar mutase [Paenibacillus turpanensis]
MSQNSNTTYVHKYEAWLHDPSIDEATKQELRVLAGQDKEVEDRFYRDLEFGTGGLRGVVGAGTNRMNIYTVGKATQGLAEHLLAKGLEKQPAAVIAYDSRNMSPEFALEAALVLAGNGVKAYVFTSLRPTPELSYAVRKLGASAGIVVTASHNPPEYNGYKVYGADGGQLVPGEAEQVIGRIQSIPSFDAIRKTSKEQAEADGLLVWIGEEIDQAYLDEVTAVSPIGKLPAEWADQVNVVYTPLHGAGNLLVRGALSRLGFTKVSIVEEQELPDPSFSTVASPNPEEKEAFTLAMKLADRVGADIIVGTDPDCDRMGAVVRDAQGAYVVLSGNQSGAILIEYLCSHLQRTGTMPLNPVVIKTIVTSEMGAAIATHYGAEVMNTLTGFKYIGEKMTQFERTGSHSFVFGYEESYGYLAGTYARDKDAVIAAMLICEAAAYYKQQGKTLYDVLQELYQRFGYYLEALQSRTMKGKDGMEQIQSIMNDWRQNPPKAIADIAVETFLDYAEGIEGLPKENVLKFILADGSWVCLRPSGTEPKIKFYFGVRGESGPDADAAVKRLVQTVMDQIDGKSK